MEFGLGPELAIGAAAAGAAAAVDDDDDRNHHFYYPTGKPKQLVCIPVQN